MEQDFFAWLKNPLKDTSGGPSGYTLFLFIGLVLAMLAAWGIIFRDVRAAV